MIIYYNDQTIITDIIFQMDYIINYILNGYQFIL